MRIKIYDGERHDEWEYVREDGAHVVIYRRGARVYFETANTKERPGGGKRGVIRDQSRASRHNAAHAFGNSSCNWLAMSVLTWRVAPTAEQVHRALEKLRRKWRVRWGESMDAWLMEMQARGVPHFHLFHARESEVGWAISAGRVEEISRRGKTKRIVRGGFDHWLVDTWLDCIADRSIETVAFQRGGICELMDMPDGAGRYVAKECAKREQKLLPARYKDGLGQWWWLNPKWKPQGKWAGQLDLAMWPFEQPQKYVWDADELTPAMTGELHGPFGAEYTAEKFVEQMRKIQSHIDRE